MLGLRSLRNRLALLFGLIVLGAILLVYLSVVPQLQGALREQKVQSLVEDAIGPAASSTSDCTFWSRSAPSRCGTTDR